MDKEPNYEEMLFFGSENIFLSQAKGEAYTTQFENFKLRELTEEEKESILNDQKDLSKYGKDHEFVYIPSFPHPHIDFNLNKNYKGSLISEFLQPLIKDIKKENPQQYKGMRSGCRSAVVRIGNKYYRLKGCGNNDEGFPIRALGSEIYKMPRGCQFSTTCNRELYFTSVANNLLGQIQYEVANIPLGFWNYKELPKNLYNDLPILDKLCSIFETYGDKRFGTHLLQAINIIINTISSTICSQNLAKEEYFNEILKLFKNERFDKNGNLQLGYHILKDYKPPKVNGEYLSNKEHCKNKIFEDSELEKFFSYECLEKEKSKFNELIQLFEKFKYLSPIHKKYEAIISKIYNDIENLVKKSNLSFFELTFQLFAICGREMGRIVRLFQDNDFNWGCFISFYAEGVHNNVHMNNFIILPPNHKTILAPLDFDCSFNRSGYFDIVDDSKTYKTHSDLMFDEWISNARHFITKQILGQENMDFEFNRNKGDEKSKFAMKVSNIIKTMLSDSIFVEFAKGYDEKGNEDKFSFQTCKNDLYPIIRLLLAITQDEIA